MTKNILIAALCASLKEMLAVYWGEGDGMVPPSFILRAEWLVKRSEEKLPND